MLYISPPRKSFMDFRDAQNLMILTYGETATFMLRGDHGIFMKQEGFKSFPKACRGI